MPDYQIRIFKAWETRDSLRRWVNNYEIASSATSPGAMLATATAIADAERNIHLELVQFLSYTISTWAEDSEPYNPESFVSGALSGTGLRDVPEGVDPMDTNVALYVRRRVTTGRMGKLFFRGCLLETDVEQGSDGYVRLEAASTLNTGGADFAEFLSDISGNVSTGPNGFIMVGENTAGTIHRRFITGFDVAGVVVNRRNHRYFDRALG